MDKAINVFLAVVLYVTMIIWAFLAFFPELSLLIEALGR